jgi:DMSO/TMAO reductase YedYZ molybdopterin-dependent catalytic subunit
MNDELTTLSASDRRHLVREAIALIDNPGRRLLLRGALSVGTLAMLTGCDIKDGRAAEGALRHVSTFNDRVQAWLFDPRKLAPVYPPESISRPFPFNAFYPENRAPVINGADFSLKVGGLVADTGSWSLAKLNALPQETQITRHVCVEGWSAIGQWSGVRFSSFLRRIGADMQAGYVAFQCADGYSTSIDMPTALHPQTQLTLGFGGAVLPVRYGFPMKLRVPTKLGFKNPKHITEIVVTNQYPGGYWENRGYNWFSGL